MADGEAADRAVGGLPARAGLLEADGVEARAADLHERVARVGVDRHPPAPSRLAEVLERARGLRRLQEARVREREGDRARAVVGRVDPHALGPAAVAAAVD